MGTRGVAGFKKDGKIKAYYNHMDSYPSYLGCNIVNDIKESTDEELFEAFNNIELVDEHNDTPSDDQIKECKKYLNKSVGTRSAKDWYCLLRGTQGSLSAWIKDGLKYMVDGGNFIWDPSCLWSYIINLDEMTLEINEELEIPLEEVRSMYFDLTERTKRLRI